MTNPKPYHPARSENEPLRRLVASTEQLSAAVAPLMTCAARANAEMLSLAARRARAYFDIPRSLTACRSPVDLFALQTRFWQTMAQDYTACALRIASTAEGLSGAGATEDGKGAAPERDLLSFPNAFGFPTWPLPSESTSPREGKDRAA